MKPKRTVNPAAPGAEPSRTDEQTNSGEQWSEQSRQDLVSTVLISSAKAGLLGVWQR